MNHHLSCARLVECIYSGPARIEDTPPVVGFLNVNETKQQAKCEKKTAEVSDRVNCVKQIADLFGQLSARSMSGVLVCGLGQNKMISNRA
ncbi:uncharacterized protein Dsimw501_GD28721 [Drosophila simulans]|uniref:Uncharacterized protein n=1 Tax=Drosophila simulans TaxID=7240 RepID=A0A0J9RA85_DROSI|nr:uncharacterized protein Dsimw501_GD28721 [Drosophila simulans]